MNTNNQNQKETSNSNPIEIVNEYTNLRCKSPFYQSKKPLKKKWENTKNQANNLTKLGFLGFLGLLGLLGIFFSFILIFWLS